MPSEESMAKFPSQVSAMSVIKGTWPFPSPQGFENLAIPSNTGKISCALVSPGATIAIDEIARVMF